MCGFAGIVAWDERHGICAQVLEKMSARIAHRGPDGQGTWIDPRGRVGLVHRRLAILDLDHRADQPWSDGQGKWIVFNGEIYNFHELRHELSALRPDYAWRTECDTEVLLRTYAQWGQDALQRLDGMFAFAIWDDARQTLFLARDRMGQKPLYIAQREGVVAFASELGALRELDWMDAQVDPGSLGEYLSLGYIRRGTIYRGAAKLPPGTRSIITANSTQTEHYFTPAATVISDRQAARSTRELILSAVRRQLVADVPVGCFLSGGTDSSVIAAAMCAAAGPDQKVHTFSIGFDDPRYDETAYAKSVATHLGTEHHAFVVQSDAAADLPKLARVFGEPFADSSALPTHYLAKETRQHVKVALSGDGGDELFGGYDRYRAMRLIQRWPIFWKALAWPLGWVPAGHPKSRLTRLKRLAASARLPAGERYASYMRLFDNSMRSELLKPGLRESAGKGDDLAELYAAMASDDPVAAALALDRQTYLPEDLHTKVDRASMLHALEVRAPFMDAELLNMTAGLTQDQLLGGGPKRMLREAFAPDLPEFVFKRPKMGFAVPLGNWFRGPLREMLHDHLFAADSFAANHLQRSVIERLQKEHAAGMDHGQQLYALLMLELWWTNR